MIMARGLWLNRLVGGVPAGKKARIFLAACRNFTDNVV